MAGGFVGQTLGMGHRFFFGNTELYLELWTVISDIPGFDDQLFRYFSGTLLA